MKVVFFDKLRKTLISVSDIIQIQNSYAKCNGRNTKIWFLTLADGKERAFKQKDYELSRVEI